MQTQYTHDNTSRQLQTPVGALHYHEAGDGAPLLLLHGSGPGVSGWANFGANLPVFAQHFRTFILDMPGYGRSDSVEGFPIDVAVAAVLRFLDAQGIDRIALLGNSMGGMVGTHLAAAHPARISRLVTIGGAGANLFTPFPTEGTNLLVDFAEEPTRERLIAWLRSMVYDPSWITDALIEQRWQLATDPKNLATSRLMYSRASMQKIAEERRKNQSWAHLQAIQCPTLITWGRDDRVTPLDWAILPLRLIARGELHVFPDCGHWAMLERKAEFESVVLSFLLRDQ